MPRTAKPERYPPEFFQLARVAWRAAEPLTIPCESTPEATGLRTKLYAFFSAIDRAAQHGGPNALAQRLISARRIAALPHEEGSAGWAVEYAKDLLAAASDIEVWVEGSNCVLQPKSHNRFARRVRAVLDARQGSPEASLDRLKDLLKGQGGGE